MYRGAGAATITNWARAIIVIDPGKQVGVYRFIAAKRGKRIGWGSEFPVYETHWAHSADDKLLWVPATPEQIQVEVTGKKNPTPFDLLLYVFDWDEEPATIDQLITAVSGKIGERKVRSFLKVLLTDEKIECVEVKRTHARPEVEYRRKAVIYTCN
jgi:hypothetical protein